MKRKTIRVTRQDLNILVDTIVDSLDYGSGFLDDESMGALERTAKILNIDLDGYRYRHGRFTK